MMEDDEDINFEYLDEDEIARQLEFETVFFKAIAGTTEFEIIPIPCMDGSYLSNSEKSAIVASAVYEEKTVLYRVSLGETAIVFSKNGGKIGIVPEQEENGFQC